MSPAVSTLFIVLGFSVAYVTLSRLWRTSRKPLPPADLIGRRPDDACPVVGCRVRGIHSHTESLIRRMKQGRRS